MTPSDILLPITLPLPMPPRKPCIGKQSIYDVTLDFLATHLF